MKPPFYQVLRTAAKGLRQQYSYQYQAQHQQAANLYGNQGFSGRVYGPGEYEREQADMRAGNAKADMFDALAELYETYEKADQS